MQKYLDQLEDQKAMGVVAQFEDAFKSLPHLPKGITEFLVNIAPYLALLGAVLSILAGPLLGLASVISLLTLNPVVVLLTVAAAVITLIQAVLLFLAFSPLQKREMKGWMYMFWVEMLTVVSVVLNIFSGSMSGLIGGVLGLIIGFYILFEMKPFYGKGK